MTIQLCSFGQSTIERIYDGGWASTFWRYEFSKDGSFKWNSRGHFGNRTVTGNYQIYGDTLEITKGYENTAGTINRYYLIDGDSCIIDIRLRYAYYVLIPNPDRRWQYADERKREIKYPQVKTTNTQLTKDLDTVLNFVFNSPIVTKHYKFEKYRKRQPTILSYYQLNSNSPNRFTIGGKEPVFKIKGAIEDDFYIEVEDINQNSDGINITFKIHGETVTFSAYFRKDSGKWMLRGDLNEYNFLIDKQ